MANKKMVFWNLRKIVIAKIWKQGVEHMSLWLVMNLFISHFPLSKGCVQETKTILTVALDGL